MKPAHHDAWEQILSVAKNADLPEGPALAASYVAAGGYEHVVRRIDPSWVPSAPAIVDESHEGSMSPVAEAIAPAADAQPEGGAAVSGDE